jgi:exonuclease SbcC
VAADNGGWMKMQIERLELRNFEGYKRAEINFERGLNVITGRNSTGKTTLLDALLFALFGIVPGLEKRSLKLLVSRLQGTTGNMLVKLSANISGKHVEILREGRLIGREDEAKRFRMTRLGLKIDGREVPVNNEEELNKKITELMGMGIKMFTTLVYARQGELTNILEPKKEDMDLILGISLMKELVEQLDSVRKTLEEYEGENAKTMVAVFKERLLGVNQRIDQLNDQIKDLSDEIKILEDIVGKAKSEEVGRLLQKIDKRESLLKDIRDKEVAILNTLKEKEAKSTEDLNKQLEKLAKEERKLEEVLQRQKEDESRINDVVQQLSSRLSKIEENLENAGVSSINELEEKISSTQTELNKKEEELNAVNKEFKEVNQSRNELNGRLSALRNEIKSHQDLLAKGLPNCPTCGQKVDPDLVKQIIKKKEDEADKLDSELKEINARYEYLNKRIKQLETDESKFSTDLSNLQKTRDRLIELLEGATKEELEQRLSKERENLKRIQQVVDDNKGKLVELRGRKDDLQKAYNNVKSLENEKKKLEKDLQECIEGIRSDLQALAFPFEPNDPDLKAKIAEKLPLSVEELKRKEDELNEKSKKLEDILEELKKKKEEMKEIEEKIDKLEKRLEKAKICEELIEKIKGGIERQRELRLRWIADEALRVYETLTDQRVYKAFRINKDDYTVEVFPANLEGYIPAKRTGGGHQTLIALAIRVALLNVLNQRSLIILDEPTYGVDSENLPQLMSYFSEIAKKIDQVILITHYGLGEEEAANIVRVEIAEDGTSTVRHI